MLASKIGRPQMTLAGKSPRFLDEAAHVVERVLAVGVDLHRVREALLRAPRAGRSRPQRPCRDCSRASQQRHAGQGAQAFELLRAGVAAAVVDEKQRQALRAQRSRRRADRVLVVVDGDDDAG